MHLRSTEIKTPLGGVAPPTKLAKLPAGCTAEDIEASERDKGRSMRDFVKYLPENPIRNSASEVVKHPPTPPRALSRSPDQAALGSIRADVNL